MALVIPTKTTSHVDMFTACQRGDLESVRRSLCHGADPNCRYRGQTPLMYAAECGHIPVCELLIENGADVEARDTYNRTALHHACQRLHVEVCKILLEAGAKVDIESTLGGETPADIVHMKGSIELVRTVLYFDQMKQQQSLSIATQPEQAEAISQEQITAQEQAIPHVENHRKTILDPPSLPQPHGVPTLQKINDNALEAHAPAAASMARRPPAPERDENSGRRSPPHRW